MSSGGAWRGPVVQHAPAFQRFSLSLAVFPSRATHASAAYQSLIASKVFVQHHRAGLN
jgi:hypothetical protein